MTEHILIAEPTDFPNSALSALKSLGTVSFGPFTRNELKSALANTTILIVRLAHYIDSDIIKAAPHLKCIVTATTGLNHIDTAYTKEKNISVLSLRAETEFLETISPTADLTFALILNIIRNIPSALLHVKQGGWNRDEFKGRDLRRKTLGLYGYGRIAHKVAIMAKAFGMSVLAYDIDSAKKDDHAKFVSESDLLSQSDIISLHVLHDRANDKLFDAGKFSRLKDGAIFINTSRGELVDEDALLSGLQSGKLSAAGLDVLSNEHVLHDIDAALKNPLVNYALTHNNLLITPHIGGASIDSMERVEFFMIEKLRKWLESQ